MSGFLMNGNSAARTASSRSRGFTLSEALLSLALFGVLAAASFPVYQRFQVRNDLDVAAMTVAQSWRRAQIITQGVVGDSTWGVSVGGASITLFKGASYASRDISYDETFDMPSSVSASGLTETVFSKFTGLPQTTGTLTLTASSIDESRTVSLNEKGTVDL